MQLSICGGRHAMGGQQFGAETILIDTTAMNRMRRFEEQTGLIEMDPEAKKDLDKQMDLYRPLQL